MDDNEEKNMKVVVGIVKDLLEKHENGAYWDDILEKAKKAGMSEDETEEALNMLMDRGVLYEPLLSRLKIA